MILPFLKVSQNIFNYNFQEIFYYYICLYVLGNEFCLNLVECEKCLYVCSLPEPCTFRHCFPHGRFRMDLQSILSYSMLYFLVICIHALWHEVHLFTERTCVMWSFSCSVTRNGTWSRSPFSALPSSSLIAMAFDYSCTELDADGWNHLWHYPPLQFTSAKKWNLLINWIDKQNLLNMLWRALPIFFLLSWYFFSLCVSCCQWQHLKSTNQRN